MRRAVPDRSRLRGGASLLLALLLCVAGGCGRRSTAAAGAGVPVAGVGVSVAPGSAPPPAAEIAPLADSISNASYPSLEAARDTVEFLLRHIVNLADTAVHVSRDTVTFPYWYAKAVGKGWVVKVVVNDDSGCPVEELESALMARGWVMRNGYMADGTDGTTLGLKSRTLFCLIEGRWDGGDDSDTTYVPPPGCTVTATCVPLRADDVMP